ncbi:hypothetical protein ACLKA6_019428 [Drosophila palustris]
MLYFFLLIQLEKLHKTFKRNGCTKFELCLRVIMLKRNQNKHLRNCEFRKLHKIIRLDLQDPDIPDLRRHMLLVFFVMNQSQPASAHMFCLPFYKNFAGHYIVLIFL